jgi:hypothetical protein
LVFLGMKKIRQATFGHHHPTIAERQEQRRQMCGFITLFYTSAGRIDKLIADHRHGLGAGAVQWKPWRMCRLRALCKDDSPRPVFDRVFGPQQVLAFKLGRFCHDTARGLRNAARAFILRKTPHRRNSVDFKGVRRPETPHARRRQVVGPPFATIPNQLGRPAWLVMGEVAIWVGTAFCARSTASSRSRRHTS